MRCRAPQRTSGLCRAFIARHSIAIPHRRDSWPKKMRSATLSSELKLIGW